MIRLIILFFLTLFLTERSDAQCDLSLKLLEVVNADANQHNGSIKVEVSSYQHFTAELITYTSTEKMILKKVSGESSTVLIFNNLSAWNYYTIRIELPKEDNKLCRIRQLTDILIEEQK